MSNSQSVEHADRTTSTVNKNAEANEYVEGSNLNDNAKSHENEKRVINNENNELQQKDNIGSGIDLSTLEGWYLLSRTNPLIPFYY